MLTGEQLDEMWVSEARGKILAMIVGNLIFYLYVKYDMNKHLATIEIEKFMLTNQ